MFCLFLLASAALPQPDEARRVIEWQLRSPPRAANTEGLSPEEAQVIRQLYLQSIGQQPPQPTTHHEARNR